MYYILVLLGWIVSILPFYIYYNFTNSIKSHTNRDQILNNNLIKVKLISTKILLLLVGICFIVPIFGAIFQNGFIIAISFLIGSIFVYLLARVLLVGKIGARFSDIVFGLYIISVIIMIVTFLNVSSIDSGILSSLAMLFIGFWMVLFYISSYVNLFMVYSKNKHHIINLSRN